MSSAAYVEKVMDLERLGRCASTIGPVFTRAGLAQDRLTLARLGSGQLELDLLNATCRYRGVDLPHPVLLPLLRARLKQELATLNLGMQDLLVASFTAYLWFGTRHDPAPLLSMDPPSSVVTCMAFTECIIQTGERRIAASWADQLEWPAERAA